MKDRWADNFCLMGDIRATKSVQRGPGVELGKSLSDRILLSWKRSLLDSILPGNTGQPKQPLQEHSVRYYKSIEQTEGNNLRSPAIGESCPQL